MASTKRRRASTPFGGAAGSFDVHLDDDLPLNRSASNDGAGNSLAAKKKKKKKKTTSNRRVTFSNVAKIWAYDKNSRDSLARPTTPSKLAGALKARASPAISSGKGKGTSGKGKDNRRKTLEELDTTENVGSIIHVRQNHKRSSVGMELTESVGKIIMAQKSTPLSPAPSPHNGGGDSSLSITAQDDVDSSATVVEDSVDPVDAADAEDQPSISMEVDESRDVTEDIDDRRESMGMELTQNLGDIISANNLSRRQSVGMDITTNVGAILAAHHNSGVMEDTMDDFQSSAMDMTGDIAFTEDMSMVTGDISHVATEDADDATVTMDMTRNMGKVIHARDAANLIRGLVHPRAHLDDASDTENATQTMELTGVMDSCISWDASVAGGGEEQDVSALSARILEGVSMMDDEELVSVPNNDYTPTPLEDKLEALETKYIHQPLLEQQQWACNNLKLAVDQLEMETEQLRSSASGVSARLTEDHLEVIRSHASASTDLVWSQWRYKLEETNLERLEATLMKVQEHVGAMRKTSGHLRLAAMALHKEGRGAVRKIQDLHSILSGIPLWQLTKHTGDEIEFLLDPKAPLQPYAVGLKLGPVVGHGGHREIAEDGASFMPKGKPISDRFSLGLVKTTACPAVFAAVGSTNQLRQALEEVSFRLGRVQHLLSEVQYVQKKFDVRTGCTADDGAYAEVVFSNYATGNKFSVRFTQMHFGYPFGDLEWTFKRMCGPITQHQVDQVMRRNNVSGYGRLSRCCKALEAM